MRPIAFEGTRFGVDLQQVGAEIARKAPGAARRRSMVGLGTVGPHNFFAEEVAETVTEKMSFLNIMDTPRPSQPPCLLRKSFTVARRRKKTPGKN